MAAGHIQYRGGRGCNGPDWLRSDHPVEPRLPQRVRSNGSKGSIIAVKALLFVSAVLVGLAGIGTPADAQNYPWCAYYSGSMGGGGTNCGFVTFEQCMATVSGIGGICMRNTQFVPPAGPRARYLSPR